MDKNKFVSVFLAAVLIVGAAAHIADTNNGYNMDKDAVAAAYVDGNINDILKRLCYTVPEFSSVNQIDSNFVKNFISQSYLPSDWESYEIVEIKTKDPSGVPNRVATIKCLKVSEQEAAKKFRAIFGIEMPVCRPESENGMYQFYKDGYYYISMADGGEITYELESSSITSGGITAIFWESHGGVINGSAVKLQLLPSDGKYGYRLVSLTRVFIDNQ